MIDFPIGRLVNHGPKNGKTRSAKGYPYDQLISKLQKDARMKDVESGIRVVKELIAFSVVDPTADTLLPAQKAVLTNVFRRIVAATNSCR